MPVPLNSEILTVYELTKQIRLLLEGDFHNVWVEGEVSNIRTPSSGHAYLTLKDEKSQIKAVIFRSYMRFIRYEMQDGLHVICRGKISVYEPRGDYQLILDYIEPKGVGALQLAYEQLKERLGKEGLFDDSQKKPLPLLPKKIGLITSPSGAAVGDMVNIILRRFSNMEILIFPVRVQGEGASLEIANAIEKANTTFKVDVIIVGRGGGSMEDLWAFNEEIVARAIYHSGIPVISAVGHEIDFTLSDFVADLRAPTPSAAAELVVAKKTELLASLEHWRKRSETLFCSFLEYHRNRLDFINKRLADPRKRLDDFRLRVDDLLNRITFFVFNQIRGKREGFERGKIALFSLTPKEKAGELLGILLQLKKEKTLHMNYYLKAKRHRFEKLLDELNILSPLNILQRGYSITRKLPEYKVIKDSKELKIGDRISMKFYQGGAVGEIQECKEEN